MAKPFTDRRSAGRLLAAELDAYRDSDALLVLGLPRGGVPVAYEVATALDAPLDVLVVRKLGVPGHEELAMGAIASGGVRIINESVAAGLGLSERAVASAAAQEQIELQRREHAYRGEAAPLEVEGKTVILVDDGLATGSTMRAAVAAMRGRQAGRVVVGVPTASTATRDELAVEVDDIVCVATPEPFHAVGMWYEDFSQTQDEEVRDLLVRSRRSSGSQRRG